MSIKIMHTADLHLGSLSKSLGKEASQRSLEIIRNFYKMLEYCKKENFDLLLIAGDFIESVISADSLADIREQLKKLDIATFISPGNHDYYYRGGIYDGDWGDKVHIFKKDVEEVYLKDLNLKIYGAPFTGSYCQKSLLENFDFNKEAGDRDQGIKRILLMHGDYENASSPYNPIMADQIPADFFDYIALGHIHKRPEPIRLGKSLLSYPGCFDASAFDESGLKGFNIVKIDENKTNIEFKGFSSRLFHRINLDFSQIKNRKDGLDLCLKKAYEISPEPQKDYYRFRLTGRLDFEDLLDLNMLKADLNESLHYVDLVDLRSPALSLESLADEESIRGYFVNQIQDKMDKATEEEKEILNLALRYGLDAMEGRELDIEN